MSKICNYKCFLCGKVIGRTYEERREHIAKFHKQVLHERNIDIDKAVLVYTKLNDTKRIVPNVYMKKNTECSTKEVVNRNTTRVACLIKGKRGTEITEKHLCACCNKLHTVNWKYCVGEQKHIYICKHCHLLIKVSEGKIKILYNAVATNRKRH